MTDAIEQALQEERREIARMLHAEARKHADAAAELRADYDREDIADEAWSHDSEAATLNAWADRILARTPTVAEPEAPEIEF